MNLKQGTSLKHGEYCIDRELGHGGFGVTYLATQIGLNRKVAIKEFFMSEYCNRDSDTSQVSVPSEGSRELVEKYRKKFVKEAQTIAEMDNHHIIRIYDVFEENGTAYYVMEYLRGGSLNSRIPTEGMPEDEAVGYIREVADALGYVHSRNILHLDVKPSNILFRGNGEVVLIDFGISKHYDEAGGCQTSSTPVGISEGYAPTEQYESEGVSSFMASTDIYALGATLYCLLSGNRPPKASVVLNEGLPALPAHVSAATCKAVELAMQPRRKDRPQSVEAFLALLDAEDEDTKYDANIAHANRSVERPVGSVRTANREHRGKDEMKMWSMCVLVPVLKRMLWPTLVCVVAVISFCLMRACDDRRDEVIRQNKIEQHQQDTLVKVQEEKRLSEIEQKRQDSLALVRRRAEMEAKRKAEAEAARKAEDAKRKIEVARKAEEAKNNYETGNDYYYGGNGKKRDYSEAVKWYLKAAEQGNPLAQFSLGTCYEYGHGVGQSDTEAFKWYRKAAGQGHAFAQYNLGFGYEAGQGVEQDYAEAAKWYRKSAEQGYPGAQYNLAKCYENGTGVVQSDSEAIKWYRKASEAGFRRATKALKRLGVEDTETKE